MLCASYSFLPALAIAVTIRQLYKCCMHTRVLCPLLLGFIIMICYSAVPSAYAQRGAPPQFTNVAGTSGVRFTHSIGVKKMENILQSTPSGCALFDYDNDNFLDAFFVNATVLDEAGQVKADVATYHALFHNEGDGTFKRVTRAAGITEATYGQGCATADYDGDGFVDLYITNYGPNKLYRNRGNGTFEDVTEQSGTGDPRYSAGCAFFDYDNDGDLDLYVSNYLTFRPDIEGVKSSEISRRMGFVAFPGPRDFPPDDDILYRNNGDGTFTDVSGEAGLVPGGRGLTVVPLDFDDDGDQDIFVANDACPNFFYKNNGDGTFTEIALEAGVAFDVDGVETAAMGVGIADFDNDGDQDLYVTNLIFEFNSLYLNQGDLTFTDGARAVGLDKDNYRHVSWANTFVDFNNDGYIDCFVGNGHVVDYVGGFSQSITYEQQNMLFMGDENGKFENMADKCGKDFIRKTVCRGGAFGDYDNDGDIDILLSNSNARGQLLRNDTPPSDRWVQIRLKGKAPNTAALGAKVITKLKDRSIVSPYRVHSAYCSSSDPTLHIGLRPGEDNGTIEVTWPLGKTSTHEFRAGARVIIEEQ